MSTARLWQGSAEYTDSLETILFKNAIITKHLLLIVHVNVKVCHCPLARHVNCVVPDASYPVLQDCVAVDPNVVTPVVSSSVTPLVG